MYLIVSILFYIFSILFFSDFLKDTNSEFLSRFALGFSALMIGSLSLYKYFKSRSSSPKMPYFLNSSKTTFLALGIVLPLIGINIMDRAKWNILDFPYDLIWGLTLVVAGIFSLTQFFKIKKELSNNSTD